MNDMPSAFNWDFDLHVPRYSGTALSEFWFNFLIMNIIFLLVSRYKFHSQEKKGLWFALLLFCLYAFWDTDYFSFARVFYEGLEDFRDPIYQYIAKISFGSYIVFRFWIWGGAILLVRDTAKRFKLNENNFCFVFTVFFLLTFSYARVSLGMALYFWGLSFLLIKDRAFFYRFLKVVVSFIFAYWAHRSMLVIILLTPLAFIKLTKKKIVFLAVLLPFIILSIQIVLGNIIAGTLLSGENEFSQSALGYAQSAIEVSFNWKWELITTLRYWSFYIALIYILYIFFIKNKWKDCTSEIRSLLTLTLFIIIIAVTILVIAGNKILGLWVVGYRYLYMSGIPLCIIMSYLYQKNIFNKRELRLLLLFPFFYAELFILGKILTMQFA